ncbi:MATE family efflux transporter [Opitutaceae bacterium TAV4]|nr:MATE family efflux transporter [Opitutaceae bacterium TAV4]RRK00998.1 MATE family efflux transporter [Opitutaceae bacterium TAV3]
MSSLAKEARATLLLAVPIIVGQMSQMLINITDSMMIGHVGTDELAAAAFAGSVFNAVCIAGFGLLVPLSIFTARAYGARNAGAIGSWLKHGLVLGTATAIVQLALLVGLTWHLDLFRQPSEVTAIVGPYYVLLAVSVVPVMVFQVFRQFAEALNRPWIPMGIMLGGVALNVFLNWILIYGRLGSPAFGLTGAGVATLIARVGTVVAIIAWARRAERLRDAWPRVVAGRRREGGAGGVGAWWRCWTHGLRRPAFGEMLKVGAPAAAMLLFETTAFGMSAIMMGWISAQALAAHQIALSCAGATFMVPLGLSMAVGIRMGTAVGEGRLEARRAIGFGALAMSSLFMSATAVFFWLSGAWLARGFVPDDPEVVALAAKLLVVAAVFQLFDGAQVVSVGALRGLTDVRVPALVTFAAYWLVAIPGGYVWGVHGTAGPLGVWMALAGGLAIAAVLLVGRLARLTR